MSNNATPGFWQSLKQAFAYGLGGNLGWHAANLLAWLLRKLWTVVGIAALGGVMSWYANSDPAPQPVKENSAVVQKKAVARATDRHEFKPHSSGIASD